MTVTDTPSSESPRLEVRVYRCGELVDTVACDDEAEAWSLAQQWSDIEDVRCEVVEIGADDTADRDPTGRDPADTEVDTAVDEDDVR